MYVDFNYQNLDARFGNVNVRAKVRIIMRNDDFGSYFGCDLQHIEMLNEAGDDVTGYVKEMPRDYAQIVSEAEMLALRECEAEIDCGEEWSAS